MIKTPAAAGGGGLNAAQLEQQEQALRRQLQTSAFMDEAYETRCKKFFSHMLVRRGPCPVRRSHLAQAGVQTGRKADFLQGCRGRGAARRRWSGSK